MSAGMTGSCFCGGVRFAVGDGAIGVVCCHCTDCRKMHGNYNAMLAVPRGAVTMQAEETLVWFESSDKARRGFCSRCGGRVFKDNLGSDRLMVSAGVIDGATGMRIIRNLWEGSRGDWYPLPEVAG